MTTDITELAQSLKRRAASANEFGEGLFFIKADDVLALLEALEKAQGMEAYWKTQCRGITDHCEVLQARIAELEESHAQVIRSRDHYKRMSEEGLKQLAESRTVTVKLPNQTEFDDPLSAYEAIEKCKEELTAQGIKWEAE